MIFKVIYCTCGVTVLTFLKTELKYSAFTYIVISDDFYLYFSYEFACKGFLVALLLIVGWFKGTLMKICTTVK